MEVKQHCWDVKLWWHDERGHFEAGANAMFPSTMAALDVIAEVARWRGVDLAVCHDVSARREPE